MSADRDDVDDYRLALAVNALGVDAGHPNANRAAVLELMQRVIAADPCAPPTPNEWQFTHALVKAIYRASEHCADPKERAAAVLKATGLVGRATDPEHADFLELAQSCHGLDGCTGLAFVKYARQRGALAEEIDDKATLQILSRWVKSQATNRADVGDCSDGSIFDSPL